jgi:hypothetical protein
VAIDAAGVRTTDFDISDEQVKQLVDNGKRFTADYLQWFNNPNSTPPPINRVTLPAI